MDISTQTKTHPLIQTLYDLPNTHYERMEAKTLGLPAKHQASYDHYIGNNIVAETVVLK
jgi:hypothetical protein